MNLFKMAKGFYVYEDTKVMAIILLIIFFIGMSLTLIGAITCYNDEKPLKGVSLAGGIIIMLASLWASIIGFFAIGTYGSDFVFPSGEFYFAAACGVGIPFVFMCYRQKYKSKKTVSITTNGSYASGFDNAPAALNQEGLVYAELKGAQRVLNVYEDRVELIQLQNLRSVFTNDFFNGNKEIMFSSMTAIQFKEASNMILGFIQFETPGNLSRDNFGSENSWTFDQSLNSKAKEIVDYCRQRIKLAHGTSQIVVQESKTSVADELKSFKELLDSGVITQEEFDAKKKQLLNL